MHSTCDTLGQALGVYVRPIQQCWCAHACHSPAHMYRTTSNFDITGDVKADSASFSSSLGHACVGNTSHGMLQHAPRHNAVRWHTRSRSAISPVAAAAHVASCQLVRWTQGGLVTGRQKHSVLHITQPLACTFGACAGPGPCGPRHVGAAHQQAVSRKPPHSQ